MTSVPAPNCRIARVTFKPGVHASRLPIGAAPQQPYDAGAGGGSRQSGWLASSAGVNTTVIAHAATLRNRARDQVRKNPWAVQIVGSFVANAIGTGIKPKSTHPDESVRESLHAAWLDWTDESDPEGVGDFYEQQALAVRAIFESGEVFIRKHRRRLNDGPEVPFQIQVLEADHVPLAENRMALGGTNQIMAGIEFDLSGRRVAYWMYREHPGEFLAPRPRSGELIRVPASEILHLFVRQRPGQVRGAPRLASVLARLHSLDQYEDAELVRKKVSALFAGFITPGADEAGVPLAKADAVPDSDGYKVASLEPGLMQVLPAGATVNFSEPTEVGGSYAPFMEWNLRGAAAGAGVTYDQATGDMTKVNFSSARVALIEFRRAIEQFQNNIPVFQLNRPIWREWLDQAALAGVIDASKYVADKRAYRAVEWIPQGWPWVDPEKDQKASVRSVRAGFTSRAAIVAAQGGDVELVDAEISADKDRAERLGLVLDSDPARVDQDGDTQAKPAGSGLPDEDGQVAALPPENEAPDPDDPEEKERREAEG